jgi:hypothetical protein
MEGRGPVLLACLVCALELRRTLVKPKGGGVGYAAVAAGIGEADDAVAAHATGEHERLRSFAPLLGGRQTVSGVIGSVVASASQCSSGRTVNPVLLPRRHSW